MSSSPCLIPLPSWCSSWYSETHSSPLSPVAHMPCHSTPLCRYILSTRNGIQCDNESVGSVKAFVLYPPSTCVDRLVHYNVSSTVRSIQPWMMQLLSGDYSITCPPPSIAWQSFIQLSELRQQGERD